MKYKVKRRILWWWVTLYDMRHKDTALWNLQYLRDLYPRRNYNLVVEED